MYPIRAVSFRQCLLGGAAVAATALSFPAFAQSTSTSGAQLDEIVVTATRQSQVLSKVPVSVSAFSQQAMEKQGIKSFEEVARFTPGVTFSSGSNNISIRGVSSGAGAGTTGIYIDDTPIQMRGLGFGADNALPVVFDLERIEVLRGPQGTLFGAGSEGGTVRYITPQPSLTEFSANARSELTSVRGGGIGGEIGAALGGPIVEDKLGFRASAFFRRGPGYIDRFDYRTGNNLEKNVNRDDTFVARAALTFAPTDNLEITPSVFMQKRYEREGDSFWRDSSNLKDGVFRNGNPSRVPSKDRLILPSVKIQNDFDGFSFISNTSYFYRDNRNGYEGTIYNMSYFQQLLQDDCTGCRTDLYPLLRATGPYLPGLPNYLSPATTDNQQNNFTQEFRLQSSNPDARLTWVAGFFYQKNRQVSIEGIHDPMLEEVTRYLFNQSAEDYWGMGLTPALGDLDYINHTIGHDKQVAGFVDATFALTSQLKIQAGMRYAHTSFDFTNYGDGAQNFGRTEGEGKQSENPFTPKVSVNFQVDDNNLIYATFSKGYRVGGANPPIPYNACKTDFQNLGLTASPGGYNSDTVRSYELGTKNKLFGNRVQLATSAYSLKWKNIQQSVGLPSCGYQYTGNLGEASSKGFDLQGQFLVMDNLTIDLAVGYTDAHYTKRVQLGRKPIVEPGDTLTSSPWTVAIGGQYKFTVGGLPAFVRADFQHRSANSDNPSNRNPNTNSYDPALVRPPATNNLSLRAGIDLDRVSFQIYADNALDSRPQLSLSHNTKQGLLWQQSTFRPRMIGLVAMYRY